VLQVYGRVRRSSLQKALRTILSTSNAVQPEDLVRTYSVLSTPLFSSCVSF
jgi:hypothetical protein